MARVKRGVTAHAKHKKVFKAAKGYYGRRKNTIRVAKQAVEKANQYAYRDRKRRKRTFRALWIQRLNAAVRPFGLTYSRFIDGLDKAGLTGRPQGAVRPRDPRAGGVPGDRREGEGRAAGDGVMRFAHAAQTGMPARRIAADGRLAGMTAQESAMSDIAQLEPKSSPTSRRPPTRRRSKPCASPRSARTARSRRC